MSAQTSASAARRGKPPWIRVRAGGGAAYRDLQRRVREWGLHTVCEEALCPNQGQCWESGRATVMILGDRCSRACGFCGVNDTPPCAPDADEPRRVAEAARGLGLEEVVVTSVTRDDLPDGGSALWAETVRRLREALPDAMIEVLVPDFGGDAACVDRVLEAGPHVFGHNLETVPSLYPRARPQADYARSLRVLRRASERGAIVKTGIMLGLGEFLEEVASLMDDARAAGCRILSIGQYLQPSRRHLPVAAYVEPSVFEDLRGEGLRRGFDVVVCGPLVRSSFHSGEQSAFVRRVLAARPEGAAS